jgi:GWxTD domain-containing protein
MVLAHEFAHLRRHDPLISALARITRTLFWFHPLVWWISRKLSELSELACDAVVLEKMSDPAAYSRVLLEFAEAVNRAGHRVALPGLAMAVSSGIAQRVDQLFELSNANARRFARPGLLLAVTGLPVLCLAATVGLSERSIRPGVPLLSASQTPPAVTIRPPVNSGKSPVRLLAQARPNTPASTLEPAWNKWLSEDVAYIITDLERQTFIALRTNEERENFVEQFWKRRDPTPDTVENEFKEEHYRRIAFANQHYLTSTVPGWKTDRGRIYITFGPPDAIESHPSGGTYERPAAQGGGELTIYPFEDWLYHYIQGVGKEVLIEFVDRSMTGEYHISLNPSEKDAFLNPPQSKGAKAAPGGNAATAIVEVAQDRRPLVQLPFFGPMFQALVTFSTPNGPAGATVVFQGSLCGNTFKPGCLTEPLYRPDLDPLEPGTYVLHAIIMDVPSGTRHSYTIPFTVN